jgi:hypothetical protein
MRRARDGRTRDGFERFSSRAPSMQFPLVSQGFSDLGSAKIWLRRRRRRPGRGRRSGISWELLEAVRAAMRMSLVVPPECIIAGPVGSGNGDVRERPQFDLAGARTIVGAPTPRTASCIALPPGGTGAGPRVARVS